MSKKGNTKAEEQHANTIKDKLKAKFTREVEKRDRRGILEMYIHTAALAVIISFLFVNFVAQRAIVNGSSMDPTLYNGESLYIDKLFWKIDGLRRYDIIVCNTEFNGGELIIKRVIGMPGERVRIDTDGIIYINGNVLEEHYGAEKIQNPGRAINEIELGEDEYFVLGDNRNMSADSRYEVIGNIRKDDIIGQVISDVDVKY